MERRRRLVATVAVLALVAVVRPAAAGKPPSTTLLFPYLSNTNGFDTEFTISNTGADPFGTQSAGGSCAITFYSGGAGTKIVIPGTILPGQSAIFLLSVIHPAFNGYAIAQCSMAFAHGIARLSDVGSRNLATTYPALILPSKRVKADERLMN